MSETPTARPVYQVPERVTQDEFLAAVQPLLDLIGVGAFEAYPDLHISPSGSGSDVLAVITATVVARSVDDDSEHPVGERGDGTFVPPQETSELSYRVTVEVA